MELKKLILPEAVVSDSNYQEAEMHKRCLFEKFFHFCRDLLENQEEIGLSRETAQKVKELKVRTKKEMIKDGADIEMITVDIGAELWSQKPDIGLINKLVDKKYDLKKESVKKFIEAFVALKTMLTPDQLKKIMVICKGHSEQKQSPETCCR